MRLIGVLACASGQAAAAVRIEGHVQAGRGPLANSTVTLWSASSVEPRQLSQARTNSDGHFELNSQETLGPDVSLYVIAKGGEAVNKGSGDNPAVALLAVLGNAPPSKVAINEMTTLASVITHAQFIHGTSIKGSPLALRIAAGNVPNFVDLNTGDYGETILNGYRRAFRATVIFGRRADGIPVNWLADLFRMALAPSLTTWSDAVACGCDRERNLWCPAAC